MQSPVRIVVSTFLLTSVIASAYPRNPVGSIRVGSQSVASVADVPGDTLLEERVDGCARVLLYGYSNSSAKLRRDGVLNLYPFPRVGRASKHTWQVPLNDLYLEYEPSAEKRQLYAFPRVGRSEASLLREPYQEPLQLQQARGPDSSGMWFGPRLGRSFKTDEDEISIQGDNVDRSDPEQMETTSHEERKKRQTIQN